ncbi:hypothetical protein ACFVIM_05515 [Streptomyces sp. NPDC057638]|uniref:hypothetical protein n=1 Tax=Streptomyces sp. NPDC057638 TaxID=3346190 RepID=UPI0036AC25CA
MTYKVVLLPSASQALADLQPAQRRAVHEAIRGPLARRPLDVGTSSGPSLRTLVLKDAGVSLKYRVYPDHVEVQIVWIFSGP